MNLAAKWQELIGDPFFRDMPYKIELNKFGQILKTSISNRRGILMNKIAGNIERAKQTGEIVMNCSILTNEGVRVADVAWASDEFTAEFGETTPFPKAPEICVEIKSPGNSRAEMEEKTRLYLEKGAQEVWIVDEKGIVNFFSHTGEIAESKIAVGFKL